MIGLFSGLVKLLGGTDGTTIGNIGDRLKVDALFSSTGQASSWPATLRYEDMNVSQGGVARGTKINTSTNWTTVYSYSGSGYVGGLIINLDTFTGWEIRLQVDSNTIFTFVSEDLTTDTLYDVDDVSNTNLAFIGVMKGLHDTFSWHPPLTIPLRYNTNVSVQLRRPTAGAKHFRAGLITLSKDT